MSGDLVLLSELRTDRLGLIARSQVEYDSTARVTIRTQRCCSYDAEASGLETTLTPQHGAISLALRVVVLWFLSTDCAESRSRCRERTELEFRASSSNHGSAGNAER
jgi:hypothetical protein